MLRIGRGIWRGQILRPDLKGVRPTSSRVREALLNIIFERLDGAIVWDFFSGSGAFGISCISCGAKKALFVDVSGKNLKIIKNFFSQRNASDSCVLLKGKLPYCLIQISRNQKADIVFLDPPYASKENYLWIKDNNWQNLVNSGGLVIVESGGEKFDTRWKTRKYGDTYISTLEV